MSHGRDNHARPYGVVGSFTTPEALLEAAQRAKDAGYRHMDGYSPIPVEGLADVVGRPKDWMLTGLVLGAGATGAIVGFALEALTSAVSYPHNVGGKPLVSIPMFFPVLYECTILFAAAAATFGMFAMNDMPKPHRPVFNAEAMVRASQDRFVLCLEASDPNYDLDRAMAFLRDQGAETVEEVWTSEGY
ncbi:MAG: DUF3341 domain-containing protein [Fimbriimonadaceae bacterium]|nr:DUF3341 domain-containing protein [Fimbriimonadaceae bacterium]QYK56416.1 MAG: DUF3341 domain-containing protein [Fimbriimonadaceae bacterium]